MEVYKAKTGDMWDAIAYKIYGNEKRATDIIAVNPRLTDVIMFKGGETIFLPDNVVSADNSTLAPWRR